MGRSAYEEYPARLPLPKMQRIAWLRRAWIFPNATTIHGSYDDIILELHQKQRHERQNGKEHESQRRKDLVRRGASLLVLVKRGIQDNVLVGQDHEDTQKESNRKGSRKSLEDKGTKDTKPQVYQSSPYSSNDESDGWIFGLLQAHHCKWYPTQVSIRSIEEEQDQEKKKAEWERGHDYLTQIPLSNDIEQNGKVPFSTE